MRRLLLAAIAAALLAFPASSSATIIFQPDYHATDPVAAGWQAMEAVSPDRMRLQGNQMRVEIRPGDIWCSGTYCAHREEVRGLRLTGGTDPHSWPLCEGCERWDRQQFYVPPDFVTTTEGSIWLVAVQFKGLFGGSPPVAVEIKLNRWQLVACGTRMDFGPVVGNSAPRIDVGMFLSPSSSTGWIEAWFNGVQVVARRACATMDDFWDASEGRMRTDPVYLKNGIYRSYAWDSWPDQLGTTHVLYFNAPLVTDARPF